ncbi:MAG: inosine-5-monophosphate dehydrogenase [Comamonas sp. SCN 67-35]|uniref:CBS domain-containing protein n=1 Tax=unclassified Comamonas TaxID=2638500 RepID=UPI00086A6018|nr:MULTISPECIES: CBS domain-containing protein [unclassified Comamonas]MBN9331115.1 CBS domain-containing protein [Comamonas sp.]ODU37275.1 MAG: inosine-5-monophosphate dehydrogenase [Comamonas sp. SCN 67-35]OJX00785.1 MAG: inosine-5-monophosphate dehydrogenase [Burkholderiales bacterium 66-26]
MTTVAEILRSKSNALVFHVSPSDTVLDALRLMAEQGIGAVVVLEGEKLAGIFTERDYARKVALLRRSSGDTPVSDIMTRAVRYVHPTQTAEECMALMTENRLRHLPVLDDGRIVGLVSIGDLVKHVISQQQFVIAQMEQYITGGGR